MILYKQADKTVHENDVLQIRLATHVWVDCVILKTVEAARAAYYKTQLAGSLYRIEARFSRNDVAKIIRYVRNNPVLGNQERRNAIATILRKYGRNNGR